MPISKGFIIAMGILILLLIAVICNTIENCVKAKYNKEVGMYKIYHENYIKNKNSETAQMEDKENEKN